MFPAMPSKKTPSARYSMRAATLEVHRLITRLGRGAQKAVALGIGITEQQMSSKLRGETDEMTLEQVGRVATLVDAPAGWPWITWPESDLLAALPRIQSRLGL